MPQHTSKMSSTALQQVVQDVSPHQSKPSYKIDPQSNSPSIGRAETQIPGVITALACKMLEEVAPLYLSALEGSREVTPECRACLRAIGEAWAATGMPIDDLLFYFSELTGNLADALLAQADTTKPRPIAGVISLANLLAREFLNGATLGQHFDIPHQTTALDHHDLAAALLEGRDLPADAESKLSSRYLIVVVRHPMNRQETPAEDTLQELKDHDALVLRGKTETVGLVPDHDRQRTRRFVLDLKQNRDPQTWIAVASRERAAVPAGHKEATDILTLAARREPGLYQVEDLLLEYAVTRNKMVSQVLADAIDPLLPHSVLYDTVDAMVQTDFVRNDAAKNLFIHRSTIDYRLSRIQELTGYDPMSGLGIQVFAMALAVRQNFHLERDIGVGQPDRVATRS